MTKRRKPDTSGLRAMITGSNCFTDNLRTMFRRALRRPALFALAVLMGCAAVVEPPGGRFGLNLFFARRFDPNADSAALDQLTNVRDLHWVREEISLSEVAPAPEKRDFKKYDRAFGVLRSRGLYPLILIGDPPSWIRNDLENQLPGLALEIVRRYYRCCSRHYQILNEVNISRFWGAPPDPAAYARVLKAVYGSIKRKFPDATIVAAGIATSDVLYFKDFVKAGGLDSADAVAVHPYTFPYPFFGWEEQAFDEFHTMVGDMPLWVTELGWPSADHREGVTEEEQASDLTRAMLSLQRRGVEKIFWYDYRDDGRDPESLEANYGLVRADNQPKLAFRAFSILMAGSRRYPTRRVVRTLTPVVEFADGFNYRYHAEDLRLGEAVLFSTPATLIGWNDPDHACLSMDVEATYDDETEAEVRPDGILVGYELQDKNGAKIQGIFGRVYWTGDRSMVAPIRLRQTPVAPPLTPPIRLNGIFLQASTLYGGGGLPDGVITISNLSTCEYFLAGG
ncbi:MAG: glycosyl hydrolase [bacterium]